MKITINGTSINALKCEEVFGYGSHALVITIDKSEIDSNSLEELVFSNEGAITKEDNGEVKTYTGFTEDVTVSIKASTYKVTLYETTSLEQKVAELTATNAELEATVAEKNSEIAELTEFIETDVDNAIKEGVNEID